MTTLTDIYGLYPGILLSSPFEVEARLKRMLGCKVLRFNPYRVADNVLLEQVERARWMPSPPSLTQMVVFHFNEIRTVHSCNRQYDVISFNIGSDRQEVIQPIKLFTRPNTYTATRRQIHVMVNKQPLTHISMVERLCGNSYFVSHALASQYAMGRVVMSYRMHSLRGSEHQRAMTIREKMIESKIAMLREVLNYPYSPQYLQCARNFINYYEPINNAIEAIRNFPNCGLK